MKEHQHPQRTLKQKCSTAFEIEKKKQKCTVMLPEYLFIKKLSKEHWVLACVHWIICMCLIVEMKEIHYSLWYTGQHSPEDHKSRGNYLHPHTGPMLLSKNSNDFKVKLVSVVHDNIFRQITVVNHMYVPLRLQWFSEAAVELQMAERRREVKGIRKDCFFFLLFTFSSLFPGI